MIVACSVAVASSVYWYVRHEADAGGRGGAGGHREQVAAREHVAVGVGRQRVVHVGVDVVLDEHVGHDPGVRAVAVARRRCTGC